MDVFAIGTLLYELYSGEVPYHGLDPQDIKAKVLKDCNLPMKMSVKKSILEIRKQYGILSQPVSVVQA